MTQNVPQANSEAWQWLEHAVDPRYLADVKGESQEVVSQARKELAESGCAVLRGFIAPDNVAKLRAESLTVADRGHFRTVYTNPYSSPDDDSFEEKHPRRYFMKRTQGFVGYDKIPEDHLIVRLYHNPIFRGFVQRCLEADEIYEYADPYGKLVYNVCEEGATHPWHFDTNEFIVSMLVAPCEAGGQFEYCPQIRNAGDENYDEVGKVIRGDDRKPVRTLKLQPGDLQIFLGRYSLHRVTEVEGKAPRVTAIFAYCREPGMIGQANRSEQLFGRVHPLHAEAGRMGRSDGLQD